MQDRPTYDDLLALIERFIDSEVVPNLGGARGYHARVAANALRMLQRELASEDAQLEREWKGLDELLGPAERPLSRAGLREALAARNEELCERIRRGDADAGRFVEAVFAHVRETVKEKLLVTNPRWVGE